MALTITQLQAGRDALVTALSNGISRVKFPDGREMEYKSTDDLQKAITQIDAEILKASGSPGGRMSFGRHSRGLCPPLGWPSPGSFD